MFIRFCPFFGRFGLILVHFGVFWVPGVPQRCPKRVPKLIPKVDPILDLEMDQKVCHRGAQMDPKGRQVETQKRIEIQTKKWTKKDAKRESKWTPKVVQNPPQSRPKLVQHDLWGTMRPRTPE